MYLRSCMIAAVVAGAAVLGGGASSLAATGSPAAGTQADHASVRHPVVYHGCVKTSGTRALFNVYVGKTPRCPKGSFSVTLNQQGPRGSAGHAGAQGAKGGTGPAGPRGPAGKSSSQGSFAAVLVAFAVGLVAGGAVVALARIRRRERQGRHPDPQLSPAPVTGVEPWRQPVPDRASRAAADPMAGQGPTPGSRTGHESAWTGDDVLSAGDGAPEPAAGLPAVPEADTPALASLRIGVLGTFTINGAPPALQPDQNQLILALALNGRAGLPDDRLCHLLGADPDNPMSGSTLRELVARTRQQLGKAADGREWIDDPGGQYALHPDARFDWADFTMRASLGMSSRDAAPLRQAMRLLRGQPFTGCHHWWLDSAFTEPVQAQITGAAAMLAELELAAGDSSASGRAARAGLACDPAAEKLWRALMRAEHAAGNPSGVREAWDRCLEAIADIAPGGQPQPETAALYQQLTRENAQ